MRVLSRLFACLAISTLALGAVLNAQDEEKPKKDADPAAEKKTEEPKPEDKKPEDKPKRGTLDDILEGKTGEKKDEEKVVWGHYMTAKIRRMGTEGTRDFVLEVMAPDPEKLLRLQQWKLERAADLARQTKAEDYLRVNRDYQLELARKMADPNQTQTLKEMEVRGSDSAVVRHMYPPLQYDDKGNLKRWTRAELAALRGKSRLVGYPATWEDVWGGQTVQAYFARPERPTARKAKLLEDDVSPGVAAKPEVVMVVIVSDALPQ